WVDTSRCSMDDGNHDHKSQDINSMYEYYQNAEVCYVYLYDFEISSSSGSDLHIMSSSWFERGRTLQKLLTPSSSSVKTFDAGWNY
ncbi:hypothetical protein K435DRAFT_675904, partial [Dendrothele bispora CBS 962.96]